MSNWMCMRLMPQKWMERPWGKRWLSIKFLQHIKRQQCLSLISKKFALQCLKCYMISIYFRLSRWQKVTTDCNINTGNWQHSVPLAFQCSGSTWWVRCKHSSPSLTRALTQANVWIKEILRQFNFCSFCHEFVFSYCCLKKS